MLSKGWTATLSPASDLEGGRTRSGWTSTLTVPLRALEKAVQRVLAVIAFLIVWQVLSSSGVINAAFLPSPVDVTITMVKLALSGELARHLLISLQRAASGFVLASLVAIPLGMAIGWYKPVERFLDPLLQSFRQTSALALFPVFILFLGIGEESKTAIIFWGAQWAMLLNTINGVKNVEPILIKSARSLAVSDSVLFRKVVLPAAFPSIITGMRLSATVSILILVAAEMIGAKAGLGFLLVNSQYNFEVQKMYAAIVTLAVLGLVVNYALVWLEKRVTSWKQQSVVL